MSEKLQTFLEGDQKSDNLIVFLQGWPDNAKMWDQINWKEDLTKYQLLFINFPNTNGRIDHKWGKDFPQLVQDIKTTIDTLNLSHKKKTLVAHDWGCFYGYLFDEKYPGFFNQLIMMDVPGKVQLTKAKQIISVILYQITLLLAFLVGGSFGKYLTHGVMKFFKHSPAYAQRITSFNNYPYYYLYRNKVLSKIKGIKPYLVGYRPSAPVFYLYGAHKPFQFHGDKWLKMVSQSGGEVHRMQGGHWFMKKYAKFITDLITRRIAPKL